jgi:hypothetical protein
MTMAFFGGSFAGAMESQRNCHPARRGPVLKGRKFLFTARKEKRGTQPCGFGVIEKWRSVGVLFGVGEAAARSLCQRFGVDPDHRVAR